MGKELWHCQGMRVQEWCQRDEFSMSLRSRNNLEQSEGEEGTAAELGGCEEPHVDHRGQWGVGVKGRFVLGLVVVW